MANQRNQRMQATILLAYENLLSDKPFRKSPFKIFRMQR